ncbi:MAG: hypothetical protein E7215_03760 [Clostridium sulfidigenes]|uniref:Uncharacterized protein n=1 Tax=Clostridium sulfidigenes TaxID=318464 RepID=A0A927ZI44_9CLOT|nr:hypothetical protein [Clostridium sulfidigenes]
MKQWSDRPKEVANNFNPAFCGEIVYYVLEEYYKERKDGLPFLLLFLVLPIVLHKETRRKIISSRGYMSVWLHQNQEVKVNFAQRANQLLDVTIETYLFLIAYKVIKLEDGKIFIETKLPKRKNELLHDETKDCIEKAKVIGRWFARNKDTATIYVMWGVRP